jgi:hypothetical protein
MSEFESLVLSLPTRNSTLRMRAWRSLKDAGCAVLRDGVYLLPAGAPGNTMLPRLASEIRAAGGFATTVLLRPKTEAEQAEFAALFERSADYGALVKRIESARASLPRLGPRKAQTAVRRVQQAFNRVSRIDFYPGQARLQAANALSALQSTLEELQAGGEPHAAKKRMRIADAERYRKRLWATRKNPWVDRLASAWLIRRFIDREARFVWLEHLRQRPKRAIGFDFDGAEFTHVDNRVTFEVLLASFGLEHDAALAAIGAAVHFLDVGGIPVADAGGLETVLKGAREKAKGDDALAAEAMRIFDLFYSAYRAKSMGQGQEGAP